jgi:hypothetical protein
LAGGLAKSNLTMPIRALKNLGILISEYYTSRTQHVTMARPKGRGQLEDKRATRRSAPPTRTRSPFEEINLVPGAATGNVIDASFGTLGRVGTAVIRSVFAGAAFGGPAALVRRDDNRWQSV